MAYFPNGDACELFQAEHCHDCIHWPDDPSKGCAVYDVHLLWNYDQIGNETVKNILSTLIDDEHKPLGEMCSMRVREFPVVTADEEEKHG